ncbi:type I secretion system permease/ATPase [Rhizorhabdus dicambivorans]|uniref:Type I secretion system permease/ATPase n=1 Tax=Rhizorhabdus dicambivorans TaxID=1850238 RepID=A0A2A4FS16_9SPHN|nr:type I secretion system permease/ATPase [Rhizorhabdus dicambivorans]ATE64045.1 type I secretion system permease/ATPase [Rhizorhabdus dicambivorans]PCE40238.1 type I secretion system permease/ATPase [Rhizorhabdus dicambivorans]
MLSVFSQKNIITDALAKGKSSFIFAALFSLASNLLYLALPIYTNQIYSRVLYSHSGSTLLVLTVGALFVFLISGLLDHYRAQVLTNFSITFDRQLASPTFAALFDLVVRRMGGSHAQALRDLDNIRQSIAGPAISVLFDLPWIPIFLGLLFIVDPWIGTLTLVGGVVLLILAYLQDRATHAALGEANGAAIKSYSFTDAALRNSEVVRALGMLPTLGRSWAQYRQTSLQMTIVANHRASFYSNAIRFIRMFIQIATIGLGAWLVIEGSISSALLFANMILASRALAPFERIVGSWKSLLETSQAYGRLEKVLNDYEAPAPTTQLPAPQGRITFEGVNFGTSGASSLILAGATFLIQPGEMVGVIGPSGAGKSTLLRLMVGIWKPTAGTVRLDGADVYSWDRGDFGRHVAYQPQDTELFAGTVRNNICRFLPDANDADIVRAAQAAGAHDLILRLPKGYDTELGEGGSILSAGQRQRVGLARTLFGDPKLIVLDEPNANLDADGEAALDQAIKGLRERGTTIVMVSHKPSVLAQADKLMLVRNGRIERFAPRDEVMRAIAPPAQQPPQRPTLAEAKP